MTTRYPSYTAEQLDTFKKAWANAQSDRTFLFIMFILPWVLFLVPTTKDWILERTPDWLRTMVMFGFGAVMIYFMARLSRCPACGKVIGESPNPRFCPACAVPLK